MVLSCLATSGRSHPSFSHSRATPGPKLIPLPKTTFSPSRRLAALPAHLDPSIRSCGRSGRVWRSWSCSGRSSSGRRQSWTSGGGCVCPTLWPLHPPYPPAHPPALPFPPSRHTLRSLNPPTAPSFIRTEHTRLALCMVTFPFHCSEPFPQGQACNVGTRPQGAGEWPGA